VLSKLFAVNPNFGTSLQRDTSYNFMLNLVVRDRHHFLYHTVSGNCKGMEKRTNSWSFLHDLRIDWPGRSSKIIGCSGHPHEGRSSHNQPMVASGCVYFGFCFSGYAN
jgi:hypothetical protein